MKNLSKIFLIVFIISAWGIIFPKRTLAQTASSVIVPNQVIVKFKQYQNPLYLQQMFENKQSQTFSSSSFNYELKNLETIIATGKSIEELLKEINTLFTQIGMQGIPTQIFPPIMDNIDLPSGLENYILITTNGLKTVNNIITLLKSFPSIASAEPNYMLYTQQQSTTPNDPRYSELWGLKKINMEGAWGLYKGDKNVKVAVVDTGINFNHEDFKDASGNTIVEKGQDFSTCERCNEQTGECIQAKKRDTNPDSSMDTNGHGTHVAGTIGAIVNNNKGIAGINWNITPLAVKVFGAGGCGSNEDIIQGIKFAADQGAKVINLSLGGKQACEGILKEMIDYALNKGVVVIAAAGNNNTDASLYAPASCPGVITVGAVGPTDQKAYYSNYNATGKPQVVDIAAPGGDKYKSQSGSACDSTACILSTVLNNSAYDLFQGTSQATPHVAGVIALMIGYYNSLHPSGPALTATRIEEILKSSADTVQAIQTLGGKRLNAAKALQALTNSDLPTSTPTPTGPTKTLTPSPTGPTKSPTPSPTGPTRTPTPTQPGENLTPSPTGNQTKPTATSAPIYATPTRLPTIPPNPCQDKAKQGDYDCSGTINQNDYSTWKSDYLGFKTALIFFEYWRKAFSSLR